MITDRAHVSQRWSNCGICGSSCRHTRRRNCGPVIEFITALRSARRAPGPVSGSLESSASPETPVQRWRRRARAESRSDICNQYLTRWSRNLCSLSASPFCWWRGAWYQWPGSAAPVVRWVAGPKARACSLPLRLPVAGKRRSVRPAFRKRSSVPGWPRFETLAGGRIPGSVAVTGESALHYAWKRSSRP